MSLVNKIIVSGHAFSMVGEEIVLSTEIPLRGWKTLDLISITTTGENVNRDLSMFYRFTKNGIVYGDWIESGLFSQISAAIKDDFLVQFKVTRVGSDKTGVVILDNIALQGDFEPLYFKVWDFIKDTIFSDIAYDDYQWNKLWINLLEKLYERGVVPEYIFRGETVDSFTPEVEEDYISFWKVVAYFYALLSELSRRKTSGLTDDDNYLIEHLEQKGLFLCKSCLSCNADHIYIMQNIFDEFRQRGTHQIAVKKGDDGKAVNGEMLRMICYDPNDEFLYEYLPRHLSGWTMNRTSPVFRGKSGHIQLNKAPEDTEDLKDLSKYGTVGNVILENDGGKEIAKLTDDSSIDFRTVIEPFLSYELSFWVKFDAPNVDMLTVEINGFIDLIPSNLQKVNGGIETKILDRVAMPNSDVYYHVKCFLMKKGSLIYGDDAKTSLMQGNNLKFTSVNTNHVNIKISCEGAGNSLKIWDIKFVPAVFDVSSVYINSYNVMNVYLINRNASTTIIEFEENMRRYMIPYGTVFQMFYSPKSQFSPEIFLAHNDSSLLLQNNTGKFLI